MKIFNNCKSAEILRKELAEGSTPHGIYGDAYSGKTFTEAEARLLEELSEKNRGPIAGGWRLDQSNPVKWYTKIPVSPLTTWEKDLLREDDEERLARERERL